MDGTSPRTRRTCRMPPRRWTCARRWCSTRLASRVSLVRRALTTITPPNRVKSQPWPPVHVKVEPQLVCFSHLPPPIAERTKHVFYLKLSLKSSEFTCRASRRDNGPPEVEPSRLATSGKKQKTSAFVTCQGALANARGELLAGTSVVSEAPLSTFRTSAPQAHHARACFG